MTAAKGSGATMGKELQSAMKRTLIFFLCITSVLLALYFMSGTYSVANNEVAIHQRFGKIINPNVRPGIHYALPWPFDRVNKVPTRVERIHIQDFSQAFSFGEGGLSFTSLTGLGTYAITGDNNLVNLECVIQYEVVDPVAYLFNTGNNVEEAGQSAKLFLREMACTAVLHCLAALDVDETLTGWDLIVTLVKNNLQQRLIDLDCGLAVTFVEIKELRPPTRVQEYFDDVINAKIDKKKAINDAESYANEEIPAARGRAERLLTDGKGYFNEVVQSAEGETDRFLRQYSEYEKNPKLVRYRLYMEAVQEVLAKVERSYIVDISDGKTPAVIKLFQ
jgi:membrane protease subunit HflK